MASENLVSPALAVFLNLRHLPAFLTVEQVAALLGCKPEHIVCLTSPYRPAIFTVANDNSVGVPLSPSNNPTLSVFIPILNAFNSPGSATQLF